MTAQSTTSSAYIFIIYISPESISFSLLWIRNWFPILIRHSNNPTFGKSDIFIVSYYHYYKCNDCVIIQNNSSLAEYKIDKKNLEQHNDVFSGTFLHFTLCFSLMNIRLKVHAQMYLVPRNQIYMLNLGELGT